MRRLTYLFQSAYRSMHSTESAVLKLLSDILLALDSGNLPMLTLLDLSAAFDSVDHNALLKRLHTSYGLGGQVINWFASYLRGRVQHVRPHIGDHLHTICGFVRNTARISNSGRFYSFCTEHR